MSRDSLHPDQQLLYEVLLDIWTKQAKRVVLAVCLSTSLLMGLSLGLIRGTRRSLRQTAVLMRNLDREVRINQVMILQQEQERRLSEVEHQMLVKTFVLLRRRMFFLEKKVVR